jgi:penicillin amidase
MFGLGFAHGQDRLWHMNFQRAVAKGRLSEIIGSEGVPIDKYMRQIGLTQRVNAHMKLIDADEL